MVMTLNIYLTCTTTAVFGIANNGKYLDTRCIEQLPSTLEASVDVKSLAVIPSIYGNCATKNVNDYRRQDHEYLYRRHVALLPL